MDLSEPFIRLGRLPGYSWGSWPWFLQPSYLFIVGSISPPAVYCGLRSLHCRPGAVPASFDFPDIYPPTSCLDGNIASIRMDCDAVSRFGCLTPALSEPCQKDKGFVRMNLFNYFRNYVILQHYFYPIVNFDFQWIFIRPNFDVTHITDGLYLFPVKNLIFLIYFRRCMEHLILMQELYKRIINMFLNKICNI